MQKRRMGVPAMGRIAEQCMRTRKHERLRQATHRLKHGRENDKMPDAVSEGLQVMIRRSAGCAAVGHLSWRSEVSVSSDAPRISYSGGLLGGGAGRSKAECPRRPGRCRPARVRGMGGNEELGNQRSWS